MGDEELNKIMMKADGDLDRLKDRCHELYEENQKLKELCDKYEEEHNTIFKEWQKDIQANKKAVEYIKEHPTKTWYYLKKNYNKKINPNTDLILCQVELLNILQNGSEEKNDKL